MNSMTKVKDKVRKTVKTVFIITGILFAIFGFGDMRMLWILEDISFKMIGICFFIEELKNKKE